jgi:hypothetical protein
MKATYRITFQDQLAFAVYHFLHSPIWILMNFGFFLFFTFESIVSNIPKGKSLAFQISFVFFGETLLAFFVMLVWVVIILISILSKKNKGRRKFFSVKSSSIKLREGFGFAC